MFCLYINKKKLSHNKLFFSAVTNVVLLMTSWWNLNKIFLSKTSYLQKRLPEQGKESWYHFVFVVFFSSYILKQCFSGSISHDSVLCIYIYCSYLKLLIENKKNVCYKFCKHFSWADIYWKTRRKSSRINEGNYGQGKNN